MNVTTIFEELQTKFHDYINKMIASKGVTHCLDDVNDCRQTVNLKLLQLARSIDRGQLDRRTDHFDRYCYRTIIYGIYDYNRSRREISMLSDGSRFIHHFMSLDDNMQDLLDVAFEPEYETAEDVWGKMLKHLEQNVEPELFTPQVELLSEKYLFDMSTTEQAKRHETSASTIAKNTKRATEDLLALVQETGFHFKGSY